MSEVDKFFEGLPTPDKKVADVFNTQPEKVVDAPGKDEDEHKVKDRRYRRLEKKLQDERESNIALAERIKVLSEVGQFRQDTGTKDDDLDPDLVEVFGDTDVGKKVARIFEKKLEGVSEKARKEALEEISKVQSQEKELVNQYSSDIDEEFANIEENYDVDITSDTPQANQLREVYVNELIRRSHKDKDGNIDSYPDFEATFEDVLAKVKPDNSKNKEIADRTMVRSGTTDTTKENDDATRRYLRSIGIKV